MRIYLLILLLPLFIIACEDDVRESIPEKVEQTVFMYLPWSTNLTNHFQQNIADFEIALQENILKDSRLIVFFSSSPTEATLFELKYKDGQNTRTTLKKYVNPPFTTKEGITSILDDVKSFAPANRYAMIIGSHGMGWLPVEREESQALKSNRNDGDGKYNEKPLFRYFGGINPDCQTDIADLAAGIAGAGIQMEYILFDNCYMSSIEVAYELKEVADYLIASPAEVIAYGFPYHKIGRYLVGEVDLQGICDGFLDFYKQYSYPYATIGVTVCAELDNLASVMQDINRRFSFDYSLSGQLQTMSGYTPEIFFDLGDYVARLCDDEDLLSRFEYQLERTVPSNLRLHTPYYYSLYEEPIRIKTYSGITTSAPSINAKAAKKTETAWYKATN